MSVRIGSGSESDSDVRSRIPRTKITNVLTERIPTSSYRDAVLNARARTGRRVGRGLVSGCFHKRQEGDVRREDCTMTTDYRWHVACINWGHDQAPHGMSYLLVDGEMQAEAYHATWGEAIHRATDSDLARRIRARAAEPHDAEMAAARDADRVARVAEGGGL